MKEKTTEMMTENYCDKCDEVVNAIFDENEFYDFKVGRVRCQCGEIVKPCNECFDENGHHYNCNFCPWEHSKIVDAMTDEEHIKWIKENDADMFNRILKGECGDYEKTISEKLIGKNEEKENDNMIGTVLNLIEKTVEQIRIKNGIQDECEEQENNDECEGITNSSTLLEYFLNECPEGFEWSQTIDEENINSATITNLNTNRMYKIKINRVG